MIPSTRPQNLKPQLTVTSPIVNKLVSSLAVAIIPDGSIHTFLCAPSVVFGTFILATFVVRLVLKVGTIRLFIAQFGKGNAHAVAAVKLCLLVAYRLRPGWNLTINLFFKCLFWNFHAGKCTVLQLPGTYYNMFLRCIIKLIQFLWYGIFNFS